MVLGGRRREEKPASAMESHIIRRGEEGYETGEERMTRISISLTCPPPHTSTSMVLQAGPILVGRRVDTSSSSWSMMSG